MIYTRIRGGLGNQLFQYCVARRLADRLGVNVGLDIREYNEDSAFEMGLHRFNLRAEYNPEGLIRHKKDGKLSYVWDVILGNQKHVYQEPFLGFDSDVLSLSNGTYFKGYWQSEKYFKDTKEQILNDLTITEKPSAENANVLKQIDNCLAVSLHIRRGDYVSNSGYNAAHGTCDLAYYQRAVAHLVDRIGKDIVVFAFSDDPEWVAENLKLPVDVKYMGHNSSQKNYEDLRLMSNCKHHIIANSSFSWWGAWLNKDPNKVVIAPQVWFADPKMSNPDILPSEWMTI